MSHYRFVKRVARVGLILALPACLGGALTGLVQPAFASATITVSSCDESHLDAAIAQANSDNAGDTVNFGCSGTIDLTSTLAITGSMTLDGSGQQVALDGQGQVGVLSVASGVTFTLNDLTIQNGSSGAGGGLNNFGGTVSISASTFTRNAAGGSGGAVSNYDGTVTISGTTFTGNHDGYGHGGAVNNSDTGTMTITGSSFIGNFGESPSPSTAGSYGGAIANFGSMTIKTTVFSDENNAQYGGAIYQGGNLASTLDITNSLFVDNIGFVAGGAIDADGGTLTIAFSTLFANVSSSGASLEHDGGTVKVGGSILANASPGNCAGAASPTDEGYNLETGTDCGFTGTGDIQNTDPGLNGDGSLARGSPAIDTVPLAQCPATDLNGNPRPDDPSETACDMGAVESAYTAAATTTTVAASASPSGYGQPVTFTATVSPTDGGGSVAFSADGTAIAGCGAQPLAQASGSYTATCTTTGLPAGSHTISAGYTGDSGYAASSASLPGGQTVNQAPLTVTASDATMTYGAAPPAITPSYSGFVNGDGPGSLASAPACSTAATSASPVGSYPSSCSGAADPNYAISYAAGQVTVTPAATSLAYTGPQAVSAGASRAPATVLSSPASACQASQPVSFTLSANPATGAVGSYPLGSATTDGSGTATGAPVSTTGWQAGAYALTASFAGTANCAASTATAALAVTAPGLAAAGAGSYPLPGAGTVSFGFIVARVPHTSVYLGALSLVSPGAWQLTGILRSYTKSSATQGSVTGTGTLSWWNPALHSHRGGWQVAGTVIAFTASFTATTQAAPGSFGIQISYTPAAPQPGTLPNSAPIGLASGVIRMA